MVPVTQPRKHLHPLIGHGERLSCVQPDPLPINQTEYEYLTINVYLHPSKRHAYTATLGSPDGEVLVTSALEPVFTACRVLKSKGMTGPVCFYRVGRDTPDFVVQDLELASGLTVRENEKQGPRIVKYRPFTGIRKAVPPSLPVFAVLPSERGNGHRPCVSAISSEAAS